MDCVKGIQQGRWVVWQDPPNLSQRDKKTPAKLLKAALNESDMF